MKTLTPSVMLKRTIKNATKTKKSYLRTLWMFVLSMGLLMGLSSEGIGQIQLSEGFEAGLPAAYAATTSYSLGSGTWTGQANGVMKGASGVHSGTSSCQLRSQAGAQVTSPNIASGGVSTVTFWGSASTASGSIQVNYSTDGGSTWTPATGSPFALTTGAAVQKTATVNSSSPNILIQFYRAAATVYIDDVVINAIAGTPTVALADNGAQVTAANVNQGTTALVLHKFSLAVSTFAASLSAMTCTTTGSYAVSDITNLKVRYSVDATLDGADATLSTITPAIAGTQTFTSFTPQSISSGSTGYIFVTADIAANATHNKTIGVNAIAFSNLTLGTINSSGSTTNGGLQTIKDVTSPTVVTLSPTDGATSVGISDNLVLTFNENVQVGTAGNIIIYNSGGTIFESIPYNDARVVFNGTTGVTINPTANLINGNAYYVQIPNTAITDLVGNAYIGISDAITWNFTAINLAGIALSSANPAVAAASIPVSSVKQSIYYFTTAVTLANTTINSVAFTTTNTAAADITKYQLWYGTSSTFGSAAQIGTDITTSLGSGTHTFSALTQAINSGVTGYFWITVDVSASATLGNTIVTSAITTTDLTFASGTKSGTAYAGGTQTISIAVSALGNYPFTGTSCSAAAYTATGVAANLTYSNITATGITCNSNVANAFSSNASWGAAFDAAKYIEFTITPAAGFLLNASTLFFDVWRSGAGATNYAIRSSIDGYAANISSGTATTTQTTISPISLGASFQNLSTAVTFRIYGYGGSGTGDFRLDAITVTGSVIPAGSILTATSSTLSGFTYSIGFGPSPAQSFNLTGILLNGSNVVLTPSTNYEISLSNAPFTPTNPITLAAFNGTSTTVYVRLKAGLPVTTYNGEIISITGGGDTDGATVSCSGSVTNPIPTVTLADNGTQITPANVLAGTTNLILHKFQLGVTVANAALTGMTCTTAGTYVTGSLTNLKAWYSTNATFESGTDVLLSTLTTPGIGGSKTFPAFIAQTINTGSTGYIFITADISASAISGNTINVNAIAVSNLTFTSATVSGTTNAGGLQTIIKPEPTNQVTAFSCGTATANTLTLSWTPAATGSQAPDGYLILWSEGAITAPADNVAQANGAGVYNITSAATASYIVTGLTANTSYNFQIWSYTNSGTSINYKLTAPPASSCTTIDGPCLSEGFTGFGSGTRAAGWAFTGFSNTTIYTTAPFIGASNPSLKMENTGDRVVTAPVSNASQLSFWIYGNGTPTTDKLLVEGLNGSVWTTIDNITPPASAGVTKTYNAGSTPALASGFTQFRFTYTSTSINLGFDDVTVYCTTCTPPTTQATNFSANTITSTSMNIAFTRGNGDGGVMVVARAGTAPTDPASGFTYTASSAFGNGAACGSGFVVYNGTASGINTASGNIAITNLAPSTTYYFAVYEYNAADDCYYLSELTGNATTLNTTATRLLFSIQPTTSGINLTMTPEVKVQAVDANGFLDVTFTGTITLTSTGTMTGPVTATAVNGIATFSSIVHTVLGTGHTLTATYAAWTPVVSTPFDIVTSTTFAPGDLIFIGYDALIVSSGMTDKIYILNMVPINPGTKFQFVNSRFEAGAAAGVRTMKWCGGSDDPNVLPAVIDITYNGAGAIAAGSIISFTIDYATPLAFWINNVSSTAAFTTSGGGANLASDPTDGDQLYLTQGTFTSYTTYALFSGSVLYGMTLTTPWVSLTDPCSAGTTGGATRESRLHPDLECFNLAVGSYKYGFYQNYALHEGSKREILVAIMGITNWKFGGGSSSLDVLQDYDTPWDDPSTTGVSLGKPFTITAASNAPDGTWVGDNTTFPNDWFYCGNWQGLAVPSENDDVYIPSNAVGYCDVNVSSVHAPKFSYIAKCKNIRMEGTSGNYYLSLKGDAADKLEVYGNLTITGNGLLDMAGGSSVDGEISLFGNWINNRGTSGFIPGKGTIIMAGSNPQSISSMALTEYFSHLTINHSSTGVTLLNDCWVSDVLTLTQGKVHTGVNYMNVTSTNPASVIGHYTDQSLGTYTLSSYVNGNLRRSVATTGTYDFPVGTPLYYELANVNLNASSGVSYLTASFKTPPDGSAPNVTVDGTLVDILLNAGYWIITPDAAVSVNYDVTASSVGHSNGGGPASSYTLLKRASILDNWASLGTHNNATQTLYGSGASEVITAKRTAYTGFSHFAIAKSSVGPLPVEMLSFEALCEPKAVEIRWSTASESNNDFFTIDRSTDAKTYHQIAEVKGAGNSNKLLQYSFIDTDPLQGISYYRLSQRDYDGRSETFDPISSQCSSNDDEAFRLVSVANNGTEPQIAYYISTNAQVSVCVYDVTGRRIDCFDHTGEAGLRMIDLDINAGAGLYLVSLTDGSRVLSAKVFIR